MDNAICCIKKDEYFYIRECGKRKNFFVAEIQGSKIQNLESYLHEAWEKLQFPQTGFINYDAYLDWIRDLDWLNRDGYIVAILDFDQFLSKSPMQKKEIIEDFSEVIIPWWQGTVEQCVVDGKAKPFIVYLVD